ncbi:undecaprenyl diphosphate synthase [Rhizobium metallidurans]|uniref:Isoprenyl transferase n=1 Tax=Rhizobium metallidurans TaxID=1265931 RepID=A0A7W6CSA4_9HYPH|nr:undecaprenyl diphosphate synthase [Rhizobium metallidurans]
MTVPEHVAIIMDGNGRWAKQRGLPRTMGHRKGVDAVRETVRAAGDIGVKYLTLFAFSSENWRRPETEVSDLLGLLKAFIRRDLAELHRQNVRVKIIGDRHSLQNDILDLLIDAEETTKANTALTLIIAFNYGARDEIARAMASLARDVEQGRLRSQDITPALITARLDTSGIPDPDLIIRTSGEERLSNFLLWQAAYSEFIFIPDYWPDFSRETFHAALETFASRNRRFGGLVAEAAAAVGT